MYLTQHKFNNRNVVVAAVAVVAVVFVLAVVVAVFYLEWQMESDEQRVVTASMKRVKSVENERECAHNQLRSVSVSVSVSVSTRYI